MSNVPRLSAEARKEAIVEAVQDVFAEKGFDGTTTRELAKAAGVSEALLYKHFPSKESLYAAMLDGCAKGPTFAEASRILELEASTSTLGGDGSFHDLALRARPPRRQASGGVEFSLGAQSCWATVSSLG